MISGRDLYTGTYYSTGIALTIQEQAGGLVAAMTGIPAGYEVRLRPLGEHAFRMHGGPLDQARMQFAIGPDGRALALHAGGLEFKRIDPGELDHLEITERLMEPGYQWSAEKEAAFSALLAEILASAHGGEIQYRLPYPRHDFVQFLMLQDTFIFHGSGKGDIERFEPFRTSFELYDTEGRGNLPAVYGTHDGLWAMFFAIVDRERLEGSIRNGVMYFHNFKGDQLAVYNFSINQEQLAEKPYRSGMLYLLPRETFVRLKLGGDALANEWASEAPVRPLAKLAIAPEDFPFLEQIGGHDDGPILRLKAKTDRIVQAVAAVAEPTSDSMILTFKSGPDFSDEMPAYIEEMARIMPAMVLEYGAGPPARLTFRNMPPGYRKILADQLSGTVEEE